MVRFGTQCLIGFLFVVSGCHKRYDPLGERRDALLMMDSASDTVHETRHVLAEVSKAQLDSLVQTAATLQGKQLERMHLSGPMGIPMEAVSTIDQVSLDPSQGACGGCTHLRANATGSSILGSALSSLKAAMSWDVSVDGGFELEVSSGLLMLQPVEDWDIGASVAGLPQMMNTTVEATIKNMLAELIQTNGLAQPVVLYSKMDELPFGVRSLQFEDYPGLAVSGTAYVLRGSDVAETDPLKDGWRIRLSVDSLAGLIEASLLRQPPSNGYVIGLSNVTTDDGLVIELDLTRANRRHASRRVQVHIAIEVSETISVHVAQVQLEQPDKGWRTVGMRLMGDKRLKKTLVRLLQREVPSFVDTGVGSMTLTSRVSKINYSEKSVEIVGDISLYSNDMETVGNDLVPADKENESEGSSP